jgi:hypothetical protein
LNTKEKTKILLTAVAALAIGGCGNEPPPPAEAQRSLPMPQVFGGRYQGVASSNQYAVWVVDTETGAVARCETQKCGEWVFPKTPGSAPASFPTAVGPEAVLPGRKTQK